MIVGDMVVAHVRMLQTRINCFVPTGEFETGMCMSKWFYYVFQIKPIQPASIYYYYYYYSLTCFNINASAYSQNMLLTLGRFTLPFDLILLQILSSVGRKKIKNK